MARLPRRVHARVRSTARRYAHARTQRVFNRVFLNFLHRMRVLLALPTRVLRTVIANFDYVSHKHSRQSVGKYIRITITPASNVATNKKAIKSRQPNFNFLYFVRFLLPE